jgi:hypothetical protein
MRPVCLTVLLFAVSCSLASAQQPQEYPSTSGNAFVRICSVIDKDSEQRDGSDRMHLAACLAYVEGVLDGTSQEIAYVHVMTEKEPPKPFCLPDDVEMGQIVKIVLKYVRNHPEEAHERTGFLIAVALEDTFPCTAQNSRKP